MCVFNYITDDGSGALYIKPADSVRKFYTFERLSKYAKWKNNLTVGKNAFKSPFELLYINPTTLNYGYALEAAVLPASQTI